MSIGVAEPIAGAANKMRDVRSPVFIGGVVLIAAFALIVGLVVGVSAHYRSPVPTKIADIASGFAQQPQELPAAAADLLGGGALGAAPEGSASAKSAQAGSALLQTPAIAAFAPTAAAHPHWEVPTMNLPDLGNFTLPDNPLQKAVQDAIDSKAASLATSIGTSGANSAISATNLVVNGLGNLILFAAYSKNGTGVLTGLQNLLPKLSLAGPAVAALPDLSLPKLAPLTAPSLPKLAVPALTVPALKVPRLHKRHGGIPFVPFI